MLLFLILSSEGCETQEKDACDRESNTLKMDMAVGFQPIALPFAIEYSLMEGLKFEGETGIQTPYGRIYIKSSLGFENSKDVHKVTIVLKTRTKEEYYDIINTDVAKVNIEHDQGKTSVLYHKDKIVIDLTNTNSTKLKFEVNSLPREPSKVRDAQAKVPLNVRSYGNIEAPTKSLIQEGESVRFYGCSKELAFVNGQAGYWCEVCHNGKKGWVWGWYLYVPN